MRNFIRIPLTLAAIGLLTACGSAIKLDDTPVESRVPVLVGTDAGSASGAASRGGAGGAGGPGAAGAGAARGGAGGQGSAGATGLAGGGAGGAGAGSGMGGAGSGAGGAWGAGGTAGAPGTGPGAGAVGAGGSGWGAGGAGGMGSGMGSSTGPGTALPSAVGESRLASISTVNPPPNAPRDLTSIGTVNAPPTAPRDDPAVLPQGMGRIVYFDFDSFVIRNDARPVLESHARVLTADRVRRMVIEGHTDERGGREYNLALGQKRAEAVLRALVMLGAADSQLEAVSFGKERPAVQGSDEAAWAQNRRAELKDRR